MKNGSKNGSWQETADDLRAKLSRYVSKPRFNEEFEEAFSFFFGEGPEEMQDELEPAAFSRFMEWFLYDYRLSNGHRLIELFEMEYAVELNSRARHLLGEWGKSCFTLLQVREMNRDAAVGRDLLLGGDYHLRLPPPADIEGTPAPGHLLVGRPVKVGDLWELPGGVTVLPGRLTDHVIQLIRGEYRRFRRSRGGSWLDFLHEQGFVFNDLIDNLADRLAAAEDQAVSVRIVYDVVDAQACMRALGVALDQAQVCQRQGERQLSPQVTAWPGLAGGWRLAENRLEVFCASPDYVPFTKQAVAGRLGKSVRHRLDIFSRMKPGRSADHPPLLRQEVHPGGSQETAAANETGAGETRAGETRASIYNNGSALESSTNGKAGVAVAAAAASPAGAAVTAPAVPVALREPECQTVEQQEVAGKVAKVLAQTGASKEHIDSALWLWSDYCAADKPRIRLTPAWAAAVHYVLGRVEGWHLRYAALARVYGAKSASVSRNAAQIAAVLDVEQFDDRYCVEHPVDGLLRRLGVASELAQVQQAEEIVGAGLETPPSEQSALLTRLVELRATLAEYARHLDGLAHKAQEQFFTHVGCSPDDTFWQDCFNDWFHFDWAIPVRGGRTLLAEALANGGLPARMASQLAAWVNCHPAYYVVESVYNREAGRMSGGAVNLMLRPLRGEGTLEVTWPLPGSSLQKNDVILARLVPLDGCLTSVGHALHFAAALAPAIRLRLDEEKALLEQWNGRRLKWEDISARYANRLYAIAYRAARGFPDE